MVKNCLNMVFNSTSKSLITALLALVSLAANSTLVEPAVANKITLELSPYQAVYGSNVGGIDAEMKQTLKKTDADLWQLHNSISFMFIGFEEQATFIASDGDTTAQTYRYSNKLSSSRNSNLRFDWKNSSVMDRDQEQQPLGIPAGAMDKLSFQVQLRMDLLGEGENFKEKTYQLIDRNRVKTYTVSWLGEEAITTSAGTFNAIKVKQQRPGKQRYTLIWLARDYDNFVLRIQRIDKGEADYQVDLKKAIIAGKRLTGS